MLHWVQKKEWSVYPWYFDIFSPNNWLRFGLVAGTKFPDVSISKLISESNAWEGVWALRWLSGTPDVHLNEVSDRGGVEMNCFRNRWCQTPPSTPWLLLSPSLSSPSICLSVSFLHSSSIWHTHILMVIEKPVVPEATELTRQKSFTHTYSISYIYCTHTHTLWGTSGWGWGEGMSDWVSIQSLTLL